MRRSVAQPGGAALVQRLTRALQTSQAEIRLLNRQLADANTELERRSADGAVRETEARKHGEDQVRQHQAALSHALRISTVGELATGLAHELNQPLSAIAYGVEACARYVRAGNARPGQLLALLDDASEEALRAGSIVDHLRHFIEKKKPQRERTDLCEIARNVPRLLGREIQQAEVTLRLELHPQPLPIYADRIQIEQILVNLIQNAIDAIREAASDCNKPRDERGAGKVALGNFRKVQETHEVSGQIQLQVWGTKTVAEVAVCDTGAGVSDAATERMFDAFFTTKPDGLGMGLAISRSILEAHRGRIWVTQRSDGLRGTTVRFTLPLRQPSRTARTKRVP